MHGLYLYRHGTKFAIRQDEARKVKEMHGLYLYRHGTKFAIRQDKPRKVKEMRCTVCTCTQTWYEISYKTGRDQEG